MNTMFRSLMYISSYMPLILMLYISDMEKFSINDFFVTYNRNKIFWIISFVLVLLALIVLIIWLIRMKKMSEVNDAKYPFGNIKSADEEVLTYFVTYIVPLVSLDVGSWTSITSNLLFIFVIGVFFVRNNTLHYNVILLLMGYHVYKTEEDHVIISKRKIYDIMNYDLKADQVGTSNIFYI